METSVFSRISNSQLRFSEPFVESLSQYESKSLLIGWCAVFVTLIVGLPQVVNWVATFHLFEKEAKSTVGPSKVAPPQSRKTGRSVPPQAGSSGK